MGAISKTRRTGRESPPGKHRRRDSPSLVGESVESAVHSRDRLKNADPVLRIPYQYAVSSCFSVSEEGDVESFGKFSDLLTSSESDSISGRMKLPWSVSGGLGGRGE